VRGDRFGQRENALGKGFVRAHGAELPLYFGSEQSRTGGHASKRVAPGVIGERHPQRPAAFRMRRGVQELRYAQIHDEIGLPEQAGSRQGFDVLAPRVLITEDRGFDRRRHVHAACSLDQTDRARNVFEPSDLHGQPGIFICMEIGQARRSHDDENSFDPLPACPDQRLDQPHGPG
jgi:hypothetical protein